MLMFHKVQENDKLNLIQNFYNFLYTIEDIEHIDIHGKKIAETIGFLVKTNFTDDILYAGFEILGVKKPLAILSNKTNLKEIYDFIEKLEAQEHENE